MLVLIGAEEYTDACVLRLAHLLQMQSHRVSLFIAPSADSSLFELARDFECDVLEAHELPFRVDLVVSTLAGSNKFEVWKAELDGHVKQADIAQTMVST